jgi:SAM-dependent methyltransferase
MAIIWFMVISPEKAALYDKYRLPYAADMVTDLLIEVGEVRIIADIGAGTGQLARMFSTHCTKVYAIEPDSTMLATGKSNLRGIPNIEFLEGYAEKIPLIENSVDLILIGNAFHRFKPSACQEFHRILRPPRWVALVSYHFTNQAYTELLFSRLSSLKGMAGRIDHSWQKMSIQDLFGTRPVRVLNYPQVLAEDWTDYFNGACTGIEAPEPGDPEFEQFKAINRMVFEAFAVDGRIRMNYETRVHFGQLF